MPSATINFLLDVQFGAERLRVEREAVFTIGDVKYDAQFNLVDGAQPTSQATLFDASVQTHIANWVLGIILVDPEDDYADAAAVPIVAVDFTGDAIDTPAFQVRRECPLVFTSRAAGGTAGNGLAAIDGNITRIRARNNNAGTTPDSDVNVRILLLG